MKKLLCIFGILFAFSGTIPLWARNQTADLRFKMVNIPEDGIPCSAILQSELEFVFDKYNHATESGNFEEFQKYMVEYNAALNKKSLEKLSKEELKERKKWIQGLALKNFSVQACLMFPSTETAALAFTSRDVWQGKLVDGRGAILFKKEREFWKVQGVNWTPNL